jgi:hypothetical protein
LVIRGGEVAYQAVTHLPAEMRLLQGIVKAVQATDGSGSSGDDSDISDNASSESSDSQRNTAQIQKSINSLQTRISEHEAKLRAYMENPYAYDNLGLLRDAPNDAIRQSIIDGRIRHLQNEINNWRKQVEGLLGLLGDN